MVSALWVSSGCPLASFRLVGVFLFPRLLYGCGLWKTAYPTGAVLGSVFLRRVWGGRVSRRAGRPCVGLVVGIVAASLPLVAVALGLVSVSPDYSGRAVVLSVVWDCGLSWRVSCLGASVLPLVVPSVCSGRSSVVPVALCLGGGSVSWGRVVSWSVVRLPLVWVGGVLSGLHPPPFLVSVSGLGVPLVGASGLGVVSGCRVWFYIAPVERSYILHPFSNCDKRENEKSKRDGK